MRYIGSALFACLFVACGNRVVVVGGAGGGPEDASSSSSSSGTGTAEPPAAGPSSSASSSSGPSTSSSASSSSTGAPCAYSAAWCWTDQSQPKAVGTFCTIGGKGGDCDSYGDCCAKPASACAAYDPEHCYPGGVSAPGAACRSDLSKPALDGACDSYGNCCK